MPFRSLERKSQTGLLLDHFKTRPSISAIEAAALYRIRALARRIMDLKEQGYRFATEQRTDPTGQRYVRYVFIGKDA